MAETRRARVRHLHRETTRHGRVVWYVRRADKRVRLPDDYGSKEFWAAYRRALAGEGIRIPARPTNGGGKVYLIGNALWIKIGFTTRRVDQRMAEFHTGVPVAVRPIRAFKGDRELEREMHKRFAHLRESGEWFRREGTLAAWITQGCPLDNVPASECERIVLL